MKQRTLDDTSGMICAKVVSAESILSHKVFFKEPEFSDFTSPKDANAKESVALFLTPLIVSKAAICDKDVDKIWLKCTEMIQSKHRF